MTYQAIRAGILAQGPPNGQPWGEISGDAMMQLASEHPLLEAETIHRTYPTIIHHAALSDILVSAIRKPSDPAWLIPPASEIWTPDCFLAPDGNSLRRIVLVSHWTDERKRAEARSWFTQGEIATYNLAMQIVVLVIGQQRNGKRSSPWVTGFLHPQNHGLRFRRRKAGFRSEGNPFNDKWDKIYREDHAEITREKWLQAMLVDDVLADACFRIDIPVLEPLHRQRILETAERKLDALREMKEKPDVQLSSCDWPVPCEFLRCCHSNPEREPSEKLGFVRIQTTPA